MKTYARNSLSKFCVLAGILLVAVAAVMLFSWQWGIHTSRQQASAYVDSLRSLIPEPVGAVPEERTNNTMPVLSLDGTDFVGILEMPRHGSALPVCAQWGRVLRYPCRFSGSVYDRTIQLGGTTQTGQYDFYREISVGDTFFFTDMTGNRYTYEVKNIVYEKHADQTALNREEAALTLFIKNVYAFEYILIFCDVYG